MENIEKVSSNSYKIKIKALKVLEKVEIGDSIAMNGTCFTVIEYGKNYFCADAMPETVNRTSLKSLKKGDGVNLEKSITLSTPLGGHIVTGDVDCIGIIESIKKEGIAKIYKINLTEKRYGKYLIEKGRVAIDGASLTIVECDYDSFSVSLIPHTQKEITLGTKNVGDIVNIETDMLGKYIERFINFEKKEQKSKIDINFLRENGFY